jgi:glycosyltransferase involved in cell wall biosynthesis
MKKVLFIFNRVAHYHRDLFKSLEAELPNYGLELHLLSGMRPRSDTGRVGLEEKIVSNEYKYQFVERRIGSYVLRRAEGIIGRIHDIRPHIVVCMGHVGDISHWRLIRLKRKLGFKLVAWQCGYEYNPGIVKSLLLRQFVPQFDLHLAYHTNAKNYALMHGADEKSISVIHNTINESRIHTLPKAEARAFLASKYPKIGSRKILLFVGAILKEKKIEVIIKALDRLNRADLILLVVGSGPHLGVIRDLCRSRSDVLLTGEIIEGVGPFFDASEIYLLPGTGGLGINEAMAHGLPILSGYADGSADDLVVDKENGFRLKTDAADELAGRIAEVLDNSDLAKKMGERSRAMITGEFAFSEFINRVRSGILSLA